MVIKEAKFVCSYASADKLQQLKEMPQFAFVGRSNVGKSSLINALTARNKLAKTSSTPGRTRLINIFEINHEFYLVDLPGYGYAKASKTQQESWQSLIGSYLQFSSSLKRVFVLLDSRIKPTEKDKQMLSYLYAFQIPFNIILTKTDKLSRSELQKNKKIITSEIGIGADDVILTSSQKKQNLEDVWNIVENDLNFMGE